MAADRWDWKDGEARRGPVRLAVQFNAMKGSGWLWTVRVRGAVNGIHPAVESGWISDEADARRAAEEAGDAYQREVVEAAPDEVLAEVLRARGWANDRPPEATSKIAAFDVVPIYRVGRDEIWLPRWLTASDAAVLAAGRLAWDLALDPDRVCVRPYRDGMIIADDPEISG